MTCRHGWDGWNKAERAARPPSARAAVRGGASGSPNAHASPREHTRSQSSSETSHPAGHALLESPELRSRDGAQLLLGSPGGQHPTMLFDLQQPGHVGLPPPPPGMRSMSPGLRMLGGGLSGGEASSDGAGGLSGGGILGGMGHMGGGGSGGTFGGDRGMSSMDYSSLHNPLAGAAMLHGYGDAGPAHGGGSGAGGSLPMRMLSGGGMRSLPVGGAPAVHQMLGHPDSVLGSSSGLDSRLGSAPSSFMVSGGSVVGGTPSGLVVHSGGFSAAGAVGGSWRYSTDGQSQAQGFLTNMAGDSGVGGFNVPMISTQPQSSPSISDSNCRWVRLYCIVKRDGIAQLTRTYDDRPTVSTSCEHFCMRTHVLTRLLICILHGREHAHAVMVICVQTVSPNVHTSMPNLQQQQQQQQQFMQQHQQQHQQAAQQQPQQQHMMAEMRQRSGMASMGIHRTMSEPVVHADIMVSKAHTLARKSRPAGCKQKPFPSC